MLNRSLVHNNIIILSICSFCQNWPATLWQSQLINRIFLPVNVHAVPENVYTRVGGLKSSLFSKGWQTVHNEWNDPYVNWFNNKKGREINIPLLCSLELKHVLSLTFVFLLQFSCYYPQKNNVLLYMKPANTKWPTAKIDLQIPGQVPHTHF